MAPSRIRGSAGGQVGAAYRGSVKGMKGGTILVEGAAGIELGMRMRRGVIAVRGAVREDTCPATQADCRASSS